MEVRADAVLLGALMTLGTVAWYPDDGDGASAWRLTSIEDHQLAGLVYTGAALARTVPWLRGPERARGAGRRHCRTLSSELRR